MAGPSIIVSGGMFADRLFRALRICIQELNEYYSGLVKSMEPPPHIQDTSRMNAPRFTRFKLGEAEVVLEYKRRLVLEDVTKAVFVADAKSGSEAPRLHYCKFEPSIAMWVVVTDYVEGQEVKGFLMNPAHIASLRAAVTKLHEHGLVFGDLRRPNVLLVEDRVVVVDFDWWGKAGEAQYPSDVLLSESINWHSGVGRGKFIATERDEHFFYRLTKQTLRVEID
ncbi:hypothetical protein FOMPIDRAFT_1015721 [Fomitopsis schrenkii]|uniref:Protein kinase domain-containing protein n=1 Tax=Fomitopsis schrenkii TaxID=2126942 RepID=S8E9H5_FOMSC|nr:hypothetical protein FOMPIDRAFT_1015721 [Fomitopsis schrenkii]